MALASAGVLGGFLLAIGDGDLPRHTPDRDHSRPLPPGGIISNIKDDIQRTQKQKELEARIAFRTNSSNRKS
jgi:hypothetical protein